MFFPRDMKLSDITEAIENVMKPNRHTLIKKERLENITYLGSIKSKIISLISMTERLGQPYSGAL